MTVKYIIGHWSGTNAYYITEGVRKSYQLIIDGVGNLHHGLPVGQTASTGGMNSITYNISCCGGDIYAPLSKVQCEKFFLECAKAIKKYKLTINDFYTHAEIGQMCKDKTITKLLPYNKWLHYNIGKIDLTKLPYNFNNAHGDFIRSKIQWYLERV